MAIRKRLDRGSTLRYFILIASFLFLVHNPTNVSALEFIRDQSFRVELRITLTVLILAALIVLLRHMWTAFRLLDISTIIAIVLGTVSLLWFIQEWVTQNYMTRYLTSLTVISAYLTLGQILPFYVRQLSGQSSILRHPP